MAKRPRQPSQLNWEDIRLFLAIAEAGSIRSAAKAVHLHHSTVARRLAKLEEQLQNKLIRSDMVGISSCSLTPYGADMIPLAKLMLEAAVKIKNAR
ncbi:LysR family transcriptional regulator [Methylobacterium sp. E-016]|uniref:helix-turn-helix domain-containing protein n=1 Tax=Methylobacterium sp. E-016 TaxID=2836556 RepID=UPI001FBB595C|nr:LysR family transcriptional regulator [Methylobacterium sp. E-016]MCJ2075431.1 LysR family transcriptional regulator [Methylobacterium sp. E-016]